MYLLSLRGLEAELAGRGIDQEAPVNWMEWLAGALREQGNQDCKEREAWRFKPVMLAFGK